MKSLDNYQQRIENVLQTLLIDDAQPLSTPMRYSVLDGGKRIRPLLVYAAGEALGVDADLLDKPAAAIELIHAYSLIHDDLPCMDDDPLRRGKPTSHIAFDEATAVLTGDALQTLAFEILSEPLHAISAKNQLKILHLLATASGTNGMVKGQMIDLSAVGETLTEEQLETMHNHKTGALIKASVLMPTYCNNTLDDDLIEQRENLAHYADAIGLAFQVRDDILDIQSDTETLGKQQGADIAAEKPTYPSILGMTAAKEKLYQLHQKALNSLQGFGKEADLLRDIAKFIVKRIA
ncbi:MAG: farnesyl diphosphate synthase [Cocleimonas sp.]